MGKANRIITEKRIDSFMDALREQERSAATIQKYAHNLTRLAAFFRGEPVTKAALIEWKRQLTESHSPATVNSMVTAANGFFRFLNWKELFVKPLKLQKSLFLDESRELTRSEYVRLVRAAQKKGDQRLELLQTICATGIRVSELRFITVEALSRGRAEISNKGKRRIVFLPEKLKIMLKKYVKAQKITAGAVFVARSGKPLNRCNIWREMKALCEIAGVEPGKVFPTTCGICSQGRFMPWNGICPDWRTSWAIPA